MKAKKMNCPKCGCYIAKSLDCCPACGYRERSVDTVLANTARVYKDTSGNASATKYIDIDSLKNYKEKIREAINLDGGHYDNISQAISWINISAPKISANKIYCSNLD